MGLIYMFKKKFGLIVLFFVFFLPVTNAYFINDFDSCSYSKILYVGGCGPNNYSSIQEAVCDADDGDTVFVYSGVYYEHLIINNSIFLIGEDKEKTVITGEGFGDCVFINSCNVHFSGFTVKNTSGRGIFVQSIFHNGENVNISDNIIRDTYYGIEFYHSCNNLVSGNKICNNYLGILLDATDSSVISKNNISNNNKSIVLYFSSGNMGNKIFQNNITNNYFGLIIAKAWLRVDEVFSNNFINNKVFNSFFLNCKSRWHHNFWDDKKDFLPFYFIKGNYSIVKFPKLWFWWFQIDFTPVDKSYTL